MKIQRLMQLLDCVDDALLRKPFLEAALALELAYSFALPTTKVDSVVAHFEQFHADVAKRVIGEVNELFPIAVTVTYNMVVDLYKNRYVICHEPRLLNWSDVRTQLSRPAFAASVTPQHLEVLNGQHSNVLRSELGEFIHRFVV